MPSHAPVLVESLPSLETLRSWVAPGPLPRATVYLPLQRAVPDVRQNALLLEQAARELAGRLDGDASGFVSRLRAVETDLARMPGSPAALVVLADPEHVRCVALPVAVPYGVAVASSYALRPLLRVLAGTSRYQALAVSTKRVALFEGSAEGLAPLACPGLPTSLEDALGSETTEKELRVRGTRAGGAAPAFYANRSSRDERKLDLARFHEALARALAASVADQSVPLVLVGTEEHQGGLRNLAKLPALLAEGAGGSPDHWSAAEIHARAWPVVGRWLAARRDESLAAFERARNLGKGLDFLDDVAAATVAGRVRRLWVDEARRVPGRVEPASGVVAEGSGDDDVLDGLTELVLSRGGEVLPIDGTRLPSGSGVAAELH
jgi:hypothetical protein